MRKHFLQTPTFTLFTIMFFFTSCKGQLKTPTQTENQNEPKASLIGQPILIKPIGANESSSVLCAIQDKNGNIWFGTGAGVYKYDGKLFTQFTVQDGLSSNCVWSILEDKNGNIWFGTSEGICRFDGGKIISIPINSIIRPVITDNSYYSESSTKSTVWSMLQDKSGKIWFGTGDGVYSYEGGNFARLLSNDGVINKDGLTLKLVSDILEDKNGNIWFASGMPPGYEGFCRYDGKMIESFKPKNEGWIRNVVESKNGNLLLATRHFGVWSYDGKSFTDYIQPKELIKGSLNDILEDHSGNLWVASDYGIDMGDTLGGLWHSNISANNPTEVTFTKISNKEVFFIFEDKDNYIWFGTRGMGLYRYDGEEITCFSEYKNKF
ncbi:MAG: two-component regulator propeller domain-containing protein [Elusimicrobiota bacterium]